VDAAAVEASNGTAANETPLPAEADQPGDSGALADLLTPVAEETFAGIESNPIAPGEQPANGRQTELAQPPSPAAATESSPPAQSALAAELQSQANENLGADEATATAAPAVLAGTVAPDSGDARRLARARRAWGERLETPRGIAGAQRESAMKTSIKTDESAGPTQQILPGAGSVAVPPLPKVAGATSSATKLIPAEDLAGAKLPPLPVRADAAEAPSTELRPLAPMVRIADIITREVRMFKRAADDLVEVVLTPDAKTQISLRLQWRDGQVEAQARCDFGDYKALNTQWPQLQATLASQGVRLSHLSERPQSGFTDFFNHSAFGGGNREPASRRDAEAAAHAVTSLPRFSGPAPDAPAMRRGNRNNPLLESWA
jgi:hypothetical protein